MFVSSTLSCEHSRFFHVTELLQNTLGKEPNSDVYNQWCSLYFKKAQGLRKKHTPLVTVTIMAKPLMSSLPSEIFSQRAV